MLIQFEHGTGSCRLDLKTYYDLTIAINKTGNVNCYYLEDPQFSYFESPEFSGNLNAGGSVNCEKISLYPHASGTHTECALHVVPVDFDMRHVVIPVLQWCRLISVNPEKINGDDVLTVASIAQAAHREGSEAIIIRTLPNTGEKLHKNYSGTNPPFFDPEALAYLRDLGYKHILTDLPSIDRESDEGRLAAHKQWFLENGVATPDRTITELVFINDEVKDGMYVLNMQVPKIQTDAVPSKIWIFPCN
jgi:arylformamidase